MNAKVNLKDYDNSFYTTGRNASVRVLWYFVNSWFLNCSWNVFSGFKVALLRIFGARVGDGVVIKPNVSVKYPWKLTIGNHVWLGENVWIDNLAQVTIGDNCCLSQGVMLLCGSHSLKSRTFELKIGEIVLEEGVWIGAKSIVYKNTVCRSHAVLSMNSVAIGELEAYQVYRGNPAVRVFERNVL